MESNNKILDLNSFRETRERENSSGMSFAFHSLPFLKNEALLKLMKFKFNKKNFNSDELFIDKHSEKDDNHF